MQPEKRKKIAFYLFYSGLILLIASLPLSKFTMSIGQFMIAGGWLLDGDTGGKFRKFINSRPAVILASLYVLHVTGWLWTTDFEYAWKDLRIKLPLLLMPLLLSTAPAVNRQQFKGILFALIGGVFISTVISWLIYIGVVQRPVNDIRDISIFISHIRLALLCCLAIVASSWLLLDYLQSGKPKIYYLLVPVIAWLVYFLMLIESLTGLAILTALSIIAFIIFAFKRKSAALRLVSLFFAIGVPLAIGYYIKSVNKTFAAKSTEGVVIDTISASGNTYDRFQDNMEYENGNPIWLYVSEMELKKEWNKRSRFNYEGADERGQLLRTTLIRFLTSKGLRKDSSGVSTLSESEIRSIEIGIANVDYQKNGNIRSRIHQVLWELHQYRKTGDPSGHSVAQRLEFWKAALGIISDHMLIGVGTGDVPIAFQKEYENINSRLSIEWRLRAHNQYLSVAVAFGLLGLCWFIFTLTYPLVIAMYRIDVLYISFSIISLMSMLTEDTLETQAGVTFFALFTSLFLFVNPNKRITGVK